jgi:hypothetical protein
LPWMLVAQVPGRAHRAEGSRPHADVSQVTPAWDKRGARLRRGYGGQAPRRGIWGW